MARERGSNKETAPGIKQNIGARLIKSSSLCSTQAFSLPRQIPSCDEATNNRKDRPHQQQGRDARNNRHSFRHHHIMQDRTRKTGTFCILEPAGLQPVSHCRASGLPLSTTSIIGHFYFCSVFILTRVRTREQISRSAYALSIGGGYYDIQIAAFSKHKLCNSLQLTRRRH
jgi:hypothetical protein